MTRALAPLLESFDNRPDRAWRCWACVAHLDGPEAREALRAALMTEDARVAEATLDALADVASSSASGKQRVLGLEEELQGLMASERGASAARGLLRLFRAVPEALEEDDTLEALVVLAHEPTSRRTISEDVLDTLRELDIKPPRRVRLRAQGPPGEPARRRARGRPRLGGLSEGRVSTTQAAGALRRGRRAQAELGLRLDGARAEILYKIRDWGDAQKDYRPPSTEAVA